MYASTIRNVLVRATPNKSKHKPEQYDYTIIFLDAGIATSLQTNDRNNLSDLFRAVVLNDGYTAGSLMIERARYERCTSTPNGKHDFACGVAGIVSEFHDRRKQGHGYPACVLFQHCLCILTSLTSHVYLQYCCCAGLTLGAVRVGALLGKVLDLCRRYGVEIDPAMSSVVVSMLVLEGLGRSLDPDLNLIKAAIPFLLPRNR